MIEFISSYGSDIILGSIIFIFLLTVWVARKICMSRKTCPERLRRTRNQEITQSLHLKMKRFEEKRPVKRPPSISLEVLDVDLEKVDLEATIASYWNGQ